MDDGEPEEWVIHAGAAVGEPSDKHLFPESCLQADWSEDYAKSEVWSVWSTGL